MSRRPNIAVAAAGGLGAALLGGLALEACAQGAGGDAPRGEGLFQAQCALCHGVKPGQGGGQGPNLAGVVGRRAGSAAFGYSPALKRADFHWDAARLDAYLADPQAAIPGTIMPVRIGAAPDRRDLIAYLASLSESAAAPSGATSDPPATQGAESGGWRDDAPGRMHRIDLRELPAPYATPSSGNPPARDTSAPPQLKVAAGLRVERWASDLSNPRRLIVASNGDVLVAETAAGRIRVLRPSADGSAPASSTVFASGMDGPFGMAVSPDGAWLYVAEENRVLRFPYRTGDLQARGRPEVVVARLAPSDGGHTTRDLAFSPDGKRLFVSVGSQSNVAEAMTRKSPAEARAWDAAHGLGAAWDEEENRADVLVFPAAGGAGKVYAAGLRNCVGLAVQPGSGALWCVVNERDGLGDDLVPDYATRVKPGGFYGWPWRYMGDHEEPRLKGARPDLVGKVSAPDVPIQSHSAALQIAFYQGTMIPAWRGSALVALHGSWNRSTRTGYKLVRLTMKPDGAPTGAYEDVLTGFVLDDDAVAGRPVGVAVMKDGSVLVSDDGAGAIWRISKSPPLRSGGRWPIAKRRGGGGRAASETRPLRVAAYR